MGMSDNVESMSGRRSSRERRAGPLLEVGTVSVEGFPLEMNNMGDDWKLKLHAVFRI